MEVLQGGWCNSLVLGTEEELVGGLFRRETVFWRLTGYGEEEGTEAESQVSRFRRPG